MFALYGYAITDAWVGHHITDAAGRSALAFPGVNVNVLTKAGDADPISGCAELNGFTVDIIKAAVTAASESNEEAP